MKAKIAAIIPARMASSRFPGKPLLEIAGLPMIEHVRRRALLCSDFSAVVVATCDAEIASAVERYGGKVIMTSSVHRVATERIAEAVQHLDCTHVVNVQGDEILVLPSDLSRMVKTIEAEPTGNVWNAIASIENAEELGCNSIVKCVISKSDRILFCSRNFSFLPFRNGSFEPVYKILGITAYSRSFLKTFSQLEQTTLEILESIEQSRILEQDLFLQGVRYEGGYPGINTPEEAELVKRYLTEDPIQRDVLKEIL